MKYLRYSNLKISFDVNPFVWSLKFFHQRPTGSDPYLRIFYFRILPLSISLILDNGTFVEIDYSEEVQGDEQ